MVLVVKNPPANVGASENTSLIPGSGNPLEKEMATHSHSSVLAWKISWTEEPGGLQSMRSQRVGHDGVRACTHTHTPHTSLEYKD